jgi:membrane protease YdiL (CAAX protease family)
MKAQSLDHPPSNRAQDGGELFQFGARSTKAIAAFIALAFAWSWSLGMLAQLLLDRWPVLGIILTMVSGFGPSIAGFAVVAFCSTRLEFRSWMRRSLNWQVGWQWYALAFCMPPAVMLLALGIHGALGGTVPVLPAAGQIPLAIANFGLVLLIGGPLGEEFGWRGFLMRTLTARVGWRAASLIIGVAWGLWHLPLFFIAGTAQSLMPIPVFLINILAGSVVFGWLFERTQASVLPALVLHTSLNAWAGILGIVPTAATMQPYVLVTGLLVVAAGALILTSDPQTETS